MWRFATFTMPAVALLFMHIAVDACHAQSSTEIVRTNSPQWGIQTLETIKRDLWLADRGLYAEKATAGGVRPTVPAFMWRRRPANGRLPRPPNSTPARTYRS